MPKILWCSFLSSLALAACLPAVAAADGPYEPNETAAMVTSPLTATRVDAGLETPQDDDWYLLYPQGIRQVGVLVTLNTPCSWSYGRVAVDVLDADAGSYPIATTRLGYSYETPDAPRTVDTGTFTSQPGHRYFLHVTQSGCPGALYSFAIAPKDVLGTRLAPTDPCAAGNRAAANARVKLRRLQTARRKAHGARRRELDGKIQLQAQQVTRATADAHGICTRPSLTGYAWS